MRSIIVNDIEYTNDLSIAELFSNYFCTTAPNIDQSLPQSDFNPTSYIHNYVTSNFILSPVTDEECSVLIQNMKVIEQSFNQIPI